MENWEKIEASDEVGLTIINISSDEINARSKSRVSAQPFETEMKREGKRRKEGAKRERFGVTFLTRFSSRGGDIIRECFKSSEASVHTRISVPCRTSSHWGSARMCLERWTRSQFTHSRAHRGCVCVWQNVWRRAWGTRIRVIVCRHRGTGTAHSVRL